LGGGEGEGNCWELFFVGKEATSHGKRDGMGVACTVCVPGEFLRALKFSNQGHGPLWYICILVVFIQIFSVLLVKTNKRGIWRKKACLNYDDDDDDGIAVAPDSKRGMHSGLHQRTGAAGLARPYELSFGNDCVEHKKTNGSGRCVHLLDCRFARSYAPRRSHNESHSQ